MDSATTSRSLLRSLFTRTNFDHWHMRSYLLQRILRLTALLESASTAIPDFHPQDILHLETPLSRLTSVEEG